MLKTLLTCLLLVLSARVSFAQDFGIAFTSTDLDWDAQSNTIEASCTIFLDYTAEVYYETATNCYIYYDSNIPAHIVDNDWGYGTNYANVDLEYNYPTQDTTYSTQGTFFVTLPYYYYDAGDFYYYDPYDYDFYQYTSIFEPLWYDFYGYDEPGYRVNYETLFLGYLYDSETTAPGPPVKVKVVADIVGLPSQCTSTGIYVRQMQMQLVDSSNVAINTNASIVEAYDQTPTNTCTNEQIPQASSCKPTGEGGTGQFIDTLRVDQDICDSPYHGSSCGFTLTATWSVCNGASNQLWTSQRVTHANSISVDGNTTGYSSGTIFQP